MYISSVFIVGSALRSYHFKLIMAVLEVNSFYLRYLFSSISAHFFLFNVMVYLYNLH